MSAFERVREIDPDGEPVLDGGIKQFQIKHDITDEDDWPLGNEDLWVPLGKIDEFADDSAFLHSRMAAATKGSDLSGGAC